MLPYGNIIWILAESQQNITDREDVCGIAIFLYTALNFLFIN